ncbi:MAG: formylglycine-generating enzyme family protein [Myxococcales bacterium]|nr:formylglycine-generating enzyme family protein [Myxococcales bacterium]
MEPLIVRTWKYRLWPRFVAAMGLFVWLPVGRGQGWKVRRRWLCAAVWLLLASCSVEIDDQTYSCAKHTDCGSGWVCVCSDASALGGYCVQSSGDVSAAVDSVCTVVGGGGSVDTVGTQSDGLSSDVPDGVGLDMLSDAADALADVGPLDGTGVADGVSDAGPSDGTGVVDGAVSDADPSDDTGVVDAVSDAGPSDGGGSDGCSLPTENKHGLTWVKIPKGKFWQGCPKDSADETQWCAADEKPIHEVEITRDFWLSRTEVTQKAWKDVFPNVKPWYFKNCGDDCPVEYITRWDAVLYCNALSEAEDLEKCYILDGLSCSGTPGDGYECTGVPVFKGLACPGYRLPTEAEWEYAARAGTTTAIYTGDINIQGDFNAPNLGKIAWYGGNSGVSYEGGYLCGDWGDKEVPSEFCGPHPVGGKPANAYCLVDMLGNVWEWTWDWFGETYYQDLYNLGPAVDPLGPNGGEVRVIRGGSWFNVAWGCRAAFRGRFWPADRDYLIGLRPARSIP